MDSSDLLLELGTASLFVVTRQRTAWWGTESRQYRGPASLESSFRDADTVAESWRARGSAFTIQEVPALIAYSDERRVAIVEFHSDSSFGQLYLNELTRKSLRAGTPIANAIRVLTSSENWKEPRPDDHSFISRRLRDDESVTALASTGNLRKWDSIFNAGQMSWIAGAGRHRSEGARAVRRAFLNANRDRPGKRGVPPSWTPDGRLVRTVFGGLPEGTAITNDSLPDLRALVRHLLSSLTAAEAAVLIVQFGLKVELQADQKFTLALTRPDRLSDTRSTALSRLRHPSRSQPLMNVITAR